MLGLMQDQPLMISSIIRHAARHHRAPRWFPGPSRAASTAPATPRSTAARAA